MGKREDRVVDGGLAKLAERKRELKRELVEFRLAGM